MTKSTEPLPPLRLNAKVYGILLIAATLLTLLLLAHHPMPGPHGPDEGLRAFADPDGRSHMVHGGLIALVFVICLGQSGFAWKLGIEHPAVMGGWLAHVLGTLALMTAGMINGFAVPDFAAKLSVSGPHPESLDLVALGWSLNQAATRAGLVLIAVAIVLWGHALLHHRGLARWIGLMALAIGGFSAVYVLTHAGSIGVTALFVYMAGQVLWNLTIATWMISGMTRPISPA